MNDPRGFQFPGTFEVTAFVEAGADPVATVLSQLAQAGLAADRVIYVEARRRSHRARLHLGSSREWR